MILSVKGCWTSPSKKIIFLYEEIIIFSFNVL